MNARSLLILLTLSSLLVGCPKKTFIEPDYQGQTAKLNDSYHKRGAEDFQLFYLSKLNGEEAFNVINARFDALRTEHTLAYSREIEIKPLELEVIAETRKAGFRYIADSRSYKISHTFTFTPKPNIIYTIDGELSEAYRAVWIEDESGDVIEIYSEGEKNEITTNSDTTIPSHKKTREDIFLDISTGESVELVTKKLGEPDNITIYKGNPFTGRNPATTYIYNDLGSIVFDTTRATKYKARHVSMVKVKTNDQINAEQIKRQLITTETQTLQSLAKQYYKLPVSDVSSLDTIADKIYRHHKTEDPYMIDAMAWLCKVIGQSGNLRYKDFLTDIQTNADSKKLRKYAASSLKQLKIDSPNQYNPAA